MTWLAASGHSARRLSTRASVQDRRARIPCLSVEKPNYAAAPGTRDLVRRALRRLVPGLLIAALAATGCGAEIPPYTLVTLTNGTALNLLEMRPARSPDGQKGIYLKYQTEVPAENLDSLRAEIQQIWAWFLRPLAERGQLQAAHIVATTRRQTGWVTSGYEFTMSYQRTPQGKWVRN